MNLVLASASPRRRELLTQAGFTFNVHPADIPEDPLPNEDPIAYVVRLAREKAEAVLAALRQLVRAKSEPTPHRRWRMPSNLRTRKRSRPHRRWRRWSWAQTPPS